MYLGTSVKGEKIFVKLKLSVDLTIVNVVSFYYGG